MTGPDHLHPHIGDLSEPITPVEPATLCQPLADRFEADPELRCLVVAGAEPGEDPWILGRSRFREFQANCHRLRDHLDSTPVSAIRPSNPTQCFPATALVDTVIKDILAANNPDHYEGVLVRADTGALALVDLLRLVERFHLHVGQRNRQISGERHQLHALIQHTDDLIVLLNTAMEVRWANHAASAMTIGGPLADLVHTDDRASFLRTITTLGERERSTVTARIQTPAGAWHWHTISVINLTNESSIEGYIANLSDVHERFELLEQLEKEAATDQLTGLYNRTRFFPMVEERMCDHDGPLTLLLIDLDGFKQVNDHLGHEAGDDVLRAVAKRVLRSTRTEDLVGRTGGDEFAVAATDTDPNTLAERLITNLSAPISAGQIKVALRVSIGFATWTANADMTFNDLAAHADIALQAAKSAGGSRSFQFTDSMREAVMRRRELNDRLVNALANGELDVAYQPQFSLADGQLVGFEALARWTDPVMGAISPGEFIPVAEESGAVVQLGHFVLEKSLHKLSQWRQLRPDLRVAINVSAKQLIDVSFPETVAVALSRHALPGRSLELEVTETALIDDQQTALNTLNELKTFGISIAVDDYGSGNASIAYLRQFPIDMIKADRSLLTLHDREPAKAKALLKSVTDLGDALGLVNLAEGIETDGQASLVRQLGFGLVQGFHYGRPMSGAEADELVRHLTPRPTAAKRTSRPGD